MKEPEAASGKKEKPGKKYLFDDPRNVKILLGCFYASLVVLLLIEFLLSKHPYFGWEAWPEFYAVYGFVACVVLVIVAKYFLRPLVKRDEDYYD
jgi:sterol desaturase/sphingolipid hydroxylase (fatty acid hydroxylase superfamily)